MNVKKRIKIIVDFCMAIAMLLLMAYSLIGEAAHEWIGVGMFVLVITHNALNLNWYRALRKGKYTAIRVFQTSLDMALILIMIGLMVSGIMLSRHVFSFLPDIGGASFARTLHMLCAYWGFVLMSMHIGLHANAMIGALRKAAKTAEPSASRTIVIRSIVALICVYGAYAFMKRRLASYMFLLSQFVFFDFSEPLVFFIADYLAIMGMFACAGHYIAGALRKIGQGKPQGKYIMN